MTKTVTYIDPPSGWRYGFPKIIPEDQMKRSREWLIENGYPQAEIDKMKEHFYCRYWNEEVAEVEMKVKSIKHKNKGSINKVVGYLINPDGPEATAEIERLRRALKTIQSINPSAAHAAFLMRDAALVALKEEE